MIVRRQEHWHEVGSIPRSQNSLVNPCPVCGAERYERCFTLRPAGRDKYRFYLDHNHEGRNTR